MKQSVSTTSVTAPILSPMAPCAPWFSTCTGMGFLAFLSSGDLLRGFFQFVGLLAKMGEMAANPVRVFWQLVDKAHGLP